MTFDPDVWGTISDWAIVVTAIVAAFYAKRQFDAAAIARQDVVELERANLLLRIDEKFEGAELLDSRKAWVALRDRIESEVRAEHVHADDALQAVETARKLSATLTSMWDAIGKRTKIAIGTRRPRPICDLSDCCTGSKPLVILSNEIWFRVTTCLICTIMSSFERSDMSLRISSTAGKLVR